MTESDSPAAEGSPATDNRAATARSASISVHFARAVLANAREAGADPLELLHDNRIPPRLLRESQARLSVERFADLQASTMVAMGDESLGYGRRPVPVGAWHMMCHAVISTATLGQALHRFCRFYQLFDMGFYPEFAAQGETGWVELKLDNEAGNAYLQELMLFHCHRFACWLTQAHVPAIEVSFRSPQTAAEDDYRLMFMGAPVSFDGQTTRIVFPSALLERPVTQSEAGLTRFLRHPVLMMLTERYPRDSWTQRVRNLVRQQLSTAPDLETVAAQLDLHPKTLSRRLAAEGASFSDIRNRIRRDTSLHYLGKRGLSIEEVAYRAGFSEPSAFTRAFKGWTGVTPYAYRKGLRP